ncbi:hypothetical protein COT44_00205 [Candidatus Shapirobacteria bacterium CG08_land_8_20_14_0_20_39_18]|uniref:HicB-like antitoxin of toxin-antitoxin system domain-containing protein n=1 Tax=Candidatus Shapirobacteria bacterium CG08_land_8_20_14_0_20_39_18 TaxID=1974883 RepID=A0A2M6XE63_9BACT|nr:MAG: hypothetical protein COT44_00205 [Candidatus Shapirobacteria bacterium CG08_land_8_20_14_0_20_39_18]PIY64690.1 MAG: hypothetical protein COY91_04445 [Candidatus Shapirobacteria bacterium CG_4_10_14_0_8_um_filter_39_15]PJE68142.1 MAG: hypothetical protein COU94_03470 [Candidatus Shapirobacteria bacterium CG10_big_fil_rev_8_21_14_0_10_38_8]
MTKKLSYLIKFTYDKTYKGYVADVINLYGCMSQGKTKKEAMENAKKAIQAYMEAVKKTETKKDLVKEVVNIPISFACASV